MRSDGRDVAKPSVDSIVDVGPQACQSVGSRLSGQWFDGSAVSCSPGLKYIGSWLYSGGRPSTLYTIFPLLFWRLPTA